MNGGGGELKGSKRVSEWNKKMNQVHENLRNSRASNRSLMMSLCWSAANNCLWEFFSFPSSSGPFLFQKMGFLLLPIEKLTKFFDINDKTLKAHPLMTTHRELVHRHRESYQARSRWRCACRQHEIIVVISSSPASTHARLRWNHKNRRRKSMHSLW